MKRIICLLSLFVCAFACLFPVNAAKDIESYVPADVDMLLFIDFERIFNSPFFNNVLKTNPDSRREIDKFESKLQSLGMKPEDLMQSAVLFSSFKDGAGAMVCRTNVPPAKIEQVLSVLLGGAVELKKSRIKGRKVLLIKPSASFRPRHNVPIPLDRQPSALTYLDPNTVFIAREQDFSKVFSMMKGGKFKADRQLNSWKSGINTSGAVMWMVFRFPNKVPPMGGQNPSMPGNPANPLTAGLGEKLQGGALSVCFGGREGRDIDLDTLIECKDDQTAAMFSMQIQMFTMGLGAMLGNDMALGSELAGAIKIAPSGKNIKGGIHLSDSLQHKLQDYFRRQRFEGPRRGPAGEQYEEINDDGKGPTSYTGPQKGSGNGFRQQPYQYTQPQK